MKYFINLPAAQDFNQYVLLNYAGIGIGKGQCRTIASESICAGACL